MGPGGLQSLLSGTAKPEQLDDENKWHCSGCKRAVRASRQTVLAWPPPTVLGIHLKRFDFRVAKPQGDASRPLPSPGGLLRPTGGILGWALGGMSTHGGGYGAVGGQKLNDHVEYPARIRLDETLLPRAPASSPLAPLGIDHTSIVPPRQAADVAALAAGSWHARRKLEQDRGWPALRLTPAKARALVLFEGRPERVAAMRVAACFPLAGLDWSRSIGTGSQLPATPGKPRPGGGFSPHQTDLDVLGLTASDLCAGLASLAKALSSPLRDWLLAVLDVDVPSPVTRHALNANPCRTYSLAAVCMHHGGSATSGHYTAIGATTGSGSRDRSWARYDDSYVQRVDEADALSESRDAYMLFYVQDPPTVAEGHLVSQERAMAVATAAQPGTRAALAARAVAAAVGTEAGSPAKHRLGAQLARSGVPSMHSRASLNRKRHREDAPAGRSARADGDCPRLDRVAPPAVRARMANRCTDSPASVCPTPSLQERVWSSGSALQRASSAQSSSLGSLGPSPVVRTLSAQSGSSGERARTGAAPQQLPAHGAGSMGAGPAQSVALPWTAIESSDDDEDGGDDGKEEDSAGMGAAGKRAVDAAVELVGKDDGSPVQLALSGDRTPSTPSPLAAPLSRGAVSRQPPPPPAQREPPPASAASAAAASPACAPRTPLPPTTPGLPAALPLDQWDDMASTGGVSLSSPGRPTPATSRPAPPSAGATGSNAPLRRVISPGGVGIRLAGPRRQRLWGKPAASPAGWPRARQDMLLVRDDDDDDELVGPAAGVAAKGRGTDAAGWATASGAGGAAAPTLRASSVGMPKSAAARTGSLGTAIHLPPGPGGAAAPASLGAEPAPQPRKGPVSLVSEALERLRRKSKGK